MFCQTLSHHIINKLVKQIYSLVKLKINHFHLRMLRITSKHIIKLLGIFSKKYLYHTTN